MDSISIGFSAAIASVLPSLIMLMEPCRSLESTSVAFFSARRR